MPPKVRKQKKKINNGDTNLHHTTNISNQDKESNEILEKLKTMRVLDHTPKNITPNVRNVESLLSKRMKVYITDGRIIFGDFKCLDNEGNLILTGTSQFYYEPEGLLFKIFYLLL